MNTHDRVGTVAKSGEVLGKIVEGPGQLRTPRDGYGRLETATDA
jgi:hypothetical protein